jgi:hypothetical protein
MRRQGDRPGARSGCPLNKLFPLEPVKTRVPQIERIDEDINHADRIALVDPVIEALRQPHPLRSIRPCNAPRHRGSHVKGRPVADMVWTKDRLRPIPHTAAHRSRATMGRGLVATLRRSPLTTRLALNNAAKRKAAPDIDVLVWLLRGEDRCWGGATSIVKKYDRLRAWPLP